MANKKNIRKWVRLLRSGEFKQGRGRLYRHGSYCCLGVACVAAGMKRRGGRFGAEDLALPIKAMRWLGLSSPNPILDRTQTACRLNDSGYSFAEIADLIEKKFLNQG